MNWLRPQHHDRGRLLINPAYRDLLAANGLLNFDAVMSYAGGQVLRTLVWRENLRMELVDGGGRRVVVYAKRHRAPSWLEQVLSLAAGRRVRSFGRREWDAVAALTAAGIPTAERVVVGERSRGWFAGQSFFITAELAGYRPADEVLGEMPPDRRGPLLDKIAALTRRFHDAGLNHRDFYLCHVFVRPTGERAFDLALIDLQRVARFRGWRRRWLVKDVAQLAHSARDILSQEEWEDWLCRYFGVDRLGGRERRFAKAVRRKADRIARHDARRRARLPQPSAFSHQPSATDSDD